jgi:hypothetical protein
MFVRYSCGCIGLHLVNGDSASDVVVQFCDSDSSGLGFVARDMSGKGHEPLSPGDADRLTRRISTYVAWGQEFENMARAFVRVGGAR